MACNSSDFFNSSGFRTNGSRQTVSGAVASYWRGLIVVFVSWLLMSCSLTQPSADSRYYLLSAQSLPPTSEPGSNQLTESGQVYVIGPLNFADYLQRSSVVTRVSDTEYNVAKLEQWGGKIEDEFQIALLKNLSALMPDSRFMRYPSLVSLPSSISLRADIMRFDSQLNGSARLEASWAWVRQNQVLSSGNFSRTLAAGSSTQSAVAAQSALIQSFAEALSAGLSQ
ncbi:hypothetical protein BTA51_01610 [Hahella sp. CCB-MM4]|uniref:PqiC family protein n=1 Tax=Hahella sp. (strain CCB-MM4) TaxID=1926491 RepID=UPI000B9A8258|nr:PqiC family protein [Hahella sp. CCB-MM4]OZG75113.1 hypothetical protein BTA51_01610 [Hahella sp. CCB-MM4]